MVQNFDCPNCGASLDYKGGSDATIKCPYCGKSVIVPPELRTSTAPPVDTLGGAVAHAQELAEITRLVRAGQKIAAIKLYRATFGVGLAEAKAAVEQLASGQPLVMSGTAVEMPTIDFVPNTYINVPTVQTRILGGWFWALIAIIIVVSVGAPLVATFASLGAVSGIFNQAPNLSEPTFAALEPTARPSRTPTTAPTPQFAGVVNRFGSDGTGPGKFKDAHSIAVDSNDKIYVGDYTDGRVQIFDASGKYLSQFSVGSKTDLFSLSVDRKGIVYAVADGQIQRYDSTSGKLLTPLQYSGGDRFGFATVTPDGGLLAIWYQQRNGLIESTEGHREDLVHFDASGKVVDVIQGPISSQTGDPELDTYLATDGLGNIFALGDQLDPAIFRFTPAGKFVTRIGSHGNGTGQFQSPLSIAIDSQGRIYVADVGKILVLGSDGHYIDSFDSDGAPYTMAFDDKDNLFTASANEVIEYGLSRH